MDYPDTLTWVTEAFIGASDPNGMDQWIVDRIPHRVSITHIYENAFQVTDTVTKDGNTVSAYVGGQRVATVNPSVPNEPVNVATLPLLVIAMLNATIEDDMGAERLNDYLRQSRNV